MKIPRKKNQNNQSLYQESQDYQPNMNSLKAIKQKNWKLWWRTMYGRLMNESIARSRTRGSPRWREKTMIVCSSKPDIPLLEPLHCLQYPWVGVYIRWMQTLFSKTIEQKAYEEQSQGFEVYQKETLVCRWKKTTWWRTSNAQHKHGENFL